MTNPSITREQLLAAIEAGIDAYGAPAEINEALRELGRTANMIAVGTFHGCGCPLTRIGVFPTTTYRAEWQERVGDEPLERRSCFTGAFDAAASAVLADDIAAWAGCDLTVVS